MVLSLSASSPNLGTGSAVIGEPNIYRGNVTAANLTNSVNSTPVPTQTPKVTDEVDNNSIGTSLKFSEGIKVFSANFKELTGINWGTVTIGSTNYYRIHVKNVGEQPVTLKLSVTNWTPGVDGVIGWSYNGKPVLEGETISITLKLTISRSSVENFGNNIVITTSQA